MLWERTFDDPRAGRTKITLNHYIYILFMAKWLQGPSELFSSLLEDDASSPSDLNQ
jgi:hypothetical protein